MSSSSDCLTTKTFMNSLHSSSVNSRTVYTQVYLNGFARLKRSYSSSYPAGCTIRRLERSSVLSFSARNTVIEASCKSSSPMYRRNISRSCPPRKTGHSFITRFGETGLNPHVSCSKKASMLAYAIRVTVIRGIRWHCPA